MLLWSSREQVITTRHEKLSVCETRVFFKALEPRNLALKFDGSDTNQPVPRVISANFTSIYGKKDGNKLRQIEI